MDVARYVPSFCKQFGRRLVVSTRRNSPQICFAASVIAGVACVVSACKATRKLDPVIEHHNRTLAETKEIIKNEPEHFNKQQQRRMITKVYIGTGCRLAKLYMRSVVYGAMSVAGMAAGFKIMSNRVASLTSALTVAEKKLQEKYDDNLPSTKLDKEAEDTQTQNENQPANPMYEFWWGLGDRSFSDPRIYGPYHNPQVANQNEEYLNRLLKLNGKLYYNDFLRLFRKCPMLGGDDRIGWIYDPNGGDHQVDLGLQNPRNRAFRQGIETEGCWLTPNCREFPKDEMLRKEQEMYYYYQERANRE